MSRGDELLVLGSDGLWDVMTADDASVFLVPRLYRMSQSQGKLQEWRPGGGGGGGGKEESGELD